MTATTKTNKQINICPVNILYIKLNGDCLIVRISAQQFESEIFEFCLIEKMIKTFERIQYVYYVKRLFSAESLISNVKKKKNTKWNVIKEIKKQ